MLLAHISDLHLDGIERATERATRVLAHLNALSRRPDAVLVTGDIADHGAPEEYAQAAELLAGLDAPALTCPGNHVNRLHHIAGHALLLCDSTIPGEDAGLFDDETLQWLTRTLDALGDTPALPAFHHPPATIHHPYLDSMRLTNADRLAEVLAGRRSIPALLTGHAHTPAATTFAGRPLLVAPGVVSTVRLPWVSGEGVTDRAAPPGVAFHVVDGEGRVMTHFRVVP